ncbi:MAG: hypothetical protein ACR2GN_04650 [Bacteroidia bacterium]
MNKVNTLTLILALLILSSCTPLVPFTQSVRQQYDLQEADLKSIQFYTSHDIVLRRGDVGNNKVTKEGELVVTQDRKVEEIFIKAGTPCVIQEVTDGSRVTVTFEDDGNKYLVFGNLSNRNGYYNLLALEWHQGRGVVNYGGNTYYVPRGSEHIHLLFKMKSLGRFEKEQRVVKGKKVN